MSDIEFITNGYKIPLCLEVKVDGVSVTYSRYGKDGCLFWFMGSGVPSDMPCARG